MLKPIHKSVPVFTVDPLNDARWEELVSRHPRAGVFHTSAWLSSLQRTYGYQPVAFTTCPPDKPLTNSVVFCEVRSWITGRRLVSLPFSDHCDLLGQSDLEEHELLVYVREWMAQNAYTQVEIRPTITQQSEHFTSGYLQPSEIFCLHRLSLDVPMDMLFRNLHRNCIQRKIWRAERDGLAYEKGRSEYLLRNFYNLLLRTRRRQGLPPQPLYWFRNLIELMQDNVTIRLASKDNKAVAAMLTLSNKSTVTYKYACSDERFTNLGGGPFLLWKTMQEAKNQGMQTLDLGRSELRHVGLVQFKDRLGAVKTNLTYWQYPRTRAVSAEVRARSSELAKVLFSWAPDTLLVASGRLLYRHIG
jgi:Acetyltransferase (GNAT) domain